MLLELSRKEIIRLLISVGDPGYDWYEELTRRGMGKHVLGGMLDYWQWDARAIYKSNLFDEDIYELYCQLTNKKWEHIKQNE